MFVEKIPMLIYKQIPMFIYKAVELIMVVFQCLILLFHLSMYLFIFSSFTFLGPILKEVRRVKEENKVHDIAQLHHCKVYQEP
tara:strand:- start:23 stop:271 length:249 start_codon:yes stop_codon:yes gene_type:complete